MAFAPCLDQKLFFSFSSCLLCDPSSITLAGPWPESGSSVQYVSCSCRSSPTRLTAGALRSLRSSLWSIMSTGLPATARSLHMVESAASMRIIALSQWHLYYRIVGIDAFPQGF
jgi:hypothetical protein